MTQKNGPSEADPAAADRVVPKKPYQKPEFRYERVFETRALACGKLSSTQAQCRFNQKS